MANHTSWNTEWGWSRLTAHTPSLYGWGGFTKDTHPSFPGIMYVYVCLVPATANESQYIFPCSSWLTTKDHVYKGGVWALVFGITVIVVLIKDKDCGNNDCWMEYEVLLVVRSYCGNPPGPPPGILAGRCWSRAYIRVPYTLATATGSLSGSSRDYGSVSIVLAIGASLGSVSLAG